MPNAQQPLNDPASPVDLSSEGLRARLQSLHKMTEQTPLFNPVFQLSLDISRAIERGALPLADVAKLVSELECEAMQSRAIRLHRLLAPVSPEDNVLKFRALVEASVPGTSFADFRARWERPLLHCVFTGHPTFLLNQAQSEAIAAAACSGDASESVVCIANPIRDPITLDSEHADVIAAMQRAGDARDRMTRTILEVAAARWPDRWMTLVPAPYRLATWVGYDMDGRTDIGWATSIGYRLGEKAARLEQYAARLRPLVANACPKAKPILARLEAGAAQARAMQPLLADDLSDPADLSAAANLLTAVDPAKLHSLSGVVAALEAHAADAPLETALSLLTIAAAMRADGLGLGWIHFRVNSAQLDNAIRPRIDPCLLYTSPSPRD